MMTCAVVWRVSCDHAEDMCDWEISYGYVMHFARCDAARRRTGLMVLSPPFFSLLSSVTCRLAQCSSLLAALLSFPVDQTVRPHRAFLNLKKTWRQNLEKS